MENLIQLERLGFMNFRYDYKIELWHDIKYWVGRIITIPLCFIGLHEYKNGMR